MRISSLLILSVLLVSSAFSQPILTHKSHALKPGVDNPMTYCKYAEPGLSGSDVVWDFTSLQAIKTITGHVNECMSEDFLTANTELEEFGTRFYYNITEESVEQYGYLSKDGNTKIIYQDPYERLIFPLAFQDIYYSSFAGERFKSEKSIGSIEGDAILEADAWGKLKLPNNVEYDSTLRVKSVKAYTTNYLNRESKIKIVTYRWYNAVHRYPLLVLTEIINGEGSTTRKSTQAAYNSVALKKSIENTPVSALEADFAIFPNPVLDKLSIKLHVETADVAKISLTNINGQTVVPVFNRELDAGISILNISDEIKNLNEGIYFISVEVNNRLLIKKLSILK